MLPPELRTERLFPPDLPVDRTPDDLPLLVEPLRTPDEFLLPRELLVTPELLVRPVVVLVTSCLRVRLVFTEELASLVRLRPTIPLLRLVDEFVLPVYRVRVVSEPLVLFVLVIPEVRVLPVVLDLIELSPVRDRVTEASFPPFPRLTSPVLLGPS